MTTDAPAKPAISSRQLGSYEAEGYLSLRTGAQRFVERSRGMTHARTGCSTSRWATAPTPLGCGT